MTFTFPGKILKAGRQHYQGWGNYLYACKHESGPFCAHENLSFCTEDKRKDEGKKEKKERREELKKQCGKQKSKLSVVGRKRKEQERRIKEAKDEKGKII